MTVVRGEDTERTTEEKLSASRTYLHTNLSRLTLLADGHREVAWLRELPTTECLHMIEISSQGLSRVIEMSG